MLNINRSNKLDRLITRNGTPERFITVSFRLRTHNFVFVHHSKIFTISTNLKFCEIQSNLIALLANMTNFYEIYFKFGFQL